MVAALSLLGCESSKKNDGASNKAPTKDVNSDTKTTKNTAPKPAALPKLSDDPRAMMKEMLSIMTELSKTAAANKADCDALGKAMNKNLDALLPRLNRAKEAGKRLEKKWANKSMDERMAVIANMPEVEKMGTVGETTRAVLTKCSKHADVTRFEKRLATLIGRGP